MKLLSKERALDIGRGAYDHVVARTPLGAGNDATNPHNWHGTTYIGGVGIPTPSFFGDGTGVAGICVAQLRKDYDAKLKADGVTDEIDRLFLLAELTEQAGCGNCAEVTAAVIVWLMKHRVEGPIEKMSHADGDHTFCVLNRDWNTPVNEPAHWNEAAVYIDVWRREFSLGRDMALSNRRNFRRFGAPAYRFTVSQRWERG